MGVVRMMKNVVDIGGGEDIDALAASLITLGRRSRACAELERLEQARLQAESYDDARVIDENISRVKWGVDHLASLVPQLEERLKIARNTRQQANIRKHQAILRRRYPKFRAALEAAVEA